ncbi:hypothetical protein [Mucilaginibacter agri]|uniref:Uncharacterized protein n=1 Tax=Mucilaginibacter agri TaxID=2695265 RepID=A0A965ZEY7_9SPHI|nr:hypothetical protein [Mucilaginibacter agri]NCD68522.1 hypothetical protein [Mucilaginibacter agri]
MACKPDVKETTGQYKYFDLKGFINADSTRLNRSNPTVNKTVNHNGASETKNVKIANWGHELSLFASSDINKPSWRQSYTINTAGDSTTYKAITPDLKTRELTVAKTGDKVSCIRIVNHIKNMLYETREVLTYLPDSVYTIDKTQHVILLGNNRYIIKGKFVK